MHRGQVKCTNNRRYLPEYTEVQYHEQSTCKQVAVPKGCSSETKMDKRLRKVSCCIQQGLLQVGGLRAAICCFACPSCCPTSSMPLLRFLPFLAIHQPASLHFQHLSKPGFPARLAESQCKKNSRHHQQAGADAHAQPPVVELALQSGRKQRPSNLDTEARWNPPTAHPKSRGSVQRQVAYSQHTCSQPSAGGDGMSPKACWTNSAADSANGRSSGRGTLHISTAFTGAAMRNLPRAAGGQAS